MADLKISQLTALTSIDAASTDVLPVVDTSATTTKKISLADVSEYVINDIVFPAGVEDLDDLSDVTAPSPHPFFHHLSSTSASFHLFPFFHLVSSSLFPY